MTECEMRKALATRLETECIVRENHPDDYCPDITKLLRECVAALARLPEHEAGRLELARKFEHASLVSVSELTPEDCLRAADALRARPPLKDASREAIARIIEPMAFIIINSQRLENNQRKLSALEKADAILALSEHHSQDQGK